MREFRRPDFDVLWRIDQKCFAAGIAYSKRELASYIAKQGAFTIVGQAPEHDAQDFFGIGGFIVAEARRPIGHIISIDVLPQYRRAGLGSKLLLAAEERLLAIPCQSIKLEAAVDNASAIAFYKQHGYNVVGTIPRYYPGGLNAFVFQKDLLQEGKTAKTG